MTFSHLAIFLAVLAVELGGAFVRKVALSKAIIATLLLPHHPDSLLYVERAAIPVVILGLANVASEGAFPSLIGSRLFSLVFRQHWGLGPLVA